MNNEFEEYCVKNPYEWHSYDVGEYHISDIGTDHQDLTPKEHYGPCLRNTYWQYTDPPDFSLITKGNFLIGNIIHEKLQDIRKINQPLSIAEFPIYEYIEISDDKIALMGSVDLVEFIPKPEKRILRITDIKTASNWTFPNSPYAFNPTYISQLTLYTYLLTEYIFKRDFFDEIEMQIVYVKKTNMEIHVQIKFYDREEGKRIFENFLERCEELHNALLNDKLPDPEAMRWCKYCGNLERCVKAGGITYNEDNRCYELDDGNK